MKTAIIIPARFASTRFPGKPLALIKGKTMLSRVVEKGLKAAHGDKNVDVMVATDDARIEAHAKDIGVACVMTSENCATGSDRVLEAAEKSGTHYDFLVSLQGDAPFTPISALKKMISTFSDNPELPVITPVHRLDWNDLDALREAKKTTPFSGTTCVRGHDGMALWFSKNILPAIRDEKKLRTAGKYSPVWQHMGVYGYRTDVLRDFVRLPQSPYEILEGLEQLRFVENDIPVFTIEIDAPAGLIQAGVDSPEDIARAEKIIEKYGNDF